MKFVCVNCGRAFEKEVEKDLAEILLEIQQENSGEILKSSCCEVSHEKNKF